MALPIVQSSTNGRTNASTTASTSMPGLSYPTGIQLGDLLILTFGFGATTTINSGLPAGWNLLSQDANGTTNNIISYWKFAEATEVSGAGGNFPTLTGTVSTYGFYSFLRISNINPITSPEVATAATGTSTSPNSPSITASWPTTDVLVISYYSEDDSRSTATSGPSGYTVDIHQAGGPATAGTTGLAFGSAYVTRTATATEDPGNWSTGRSDTWVANTIIVRGLELYNITETLRLSDGSPIADGVKVVALESDAILNANPGDTLIVRAVDVISGGAGEISLTVYTSTDKVLIADYSDPSLNGETLVTTPITPTVI